MILTKDQVELLKNSGVTVWFGENDVEDCVLGLIDTIEAAWQERDSAIKELSQIKDQLVECREVREMARQEIVALKAALVGT